MRAVRLENLAPFAVAFLAVGLEFDGPARTVQPIVGARNGTGIGKTGEHVVKHAEDKNDMEYETLETGPGLESDR